MIGEIRLRIKCNMEQNFTLKILNFMLRIQCDIKIAIQLYPMASKYIVRQAAYLRKLPNSNVGVSICILIPNTRLKKAENPWQRLLP